MEGNLFFNSAQKTGENISSQFIPQSFLKATNYDYFFSKVVINTTGPVNKFYVNLGELKMLIIKKKFKEKLLEAKKLREKIGDPISFGKSIIEIPEEEAERKLSDFKGYKYVSKKF